MYGTNHLLGEESVWKFPPSSPLRPQYQQACSPQCSPYISYGTSWENLTVKKFIFDDHFCYSHDVCICSSGDNVRKNQMFLASGV